MVHCKDCAQAVLHAQGARYTSLFFFLLYTLLFSYTPIHLTPIFYTPTHLTSILLYTFLPHTSLLTPARPRSTRSSSKNMFIMDKGLDDAEHANRDPARLPPLHIE